MAETKTASAPAQPGFWSKENLISWVKIIVVILFIKGCVIDQYTIPSGSMEPTLHGDSFFKGDRVLVNKWTFGPRIPFTTIRLWDWNAPKRWDIVVFRPKPDTSEHSILIKRIVALPGERVKIHLGELYINGELMPFPEEMLTHNGEPLNFPPEMEGVGFQYYNPNDLIGIAMRTDNMRVKQHLLSMVEKYPMKYGIDPSDEYSLVPEDHYLVLGDNSINSVDGRVWGWVPRDNLFGRTFAIWWPFNRRRDFSGFSDTWWGTGLIYGIPLLLVGWEAWNFYADRRDRRRRKSPEGDISA